MNVQKGASPQVSVVELFTHSQHPLAEGLTPGVEYAERLECTARSFFRLVENGLRPPEVVVAGGRHRVGKKHDKVSLAAAGVEYLVDGKGIPSKYVHGDELAERYSPRGVYCGADEAMVAVAAFSVIAEERGLPRERSLLRAVCSAGQADRLRLHYKGFRLPPSSLDLVVINTATDVHGGLAEKALRLYTHLDPRWEGPLPDLVRSSRRPG